MSAAPVLIAAGGTGGHVYPALAVAEVLREREVPVVWLGTPQGLEGRVLPDHAWIRTEWLNMAAARGGGWRRVLQTPLRLLRAALASVRILRRHRPRTVLGMGGYVAAPAGVAARLCGVPLVVHEQNAIPGLTNRCLARIASRVFTGFPDTDLAGGRAGTPEWVGNPIRRALLELPVPRERFGSRDGALRLLVLGGSQGARALNRGVPRALGELPAERRPEVLHQAGQLTLEEAREAYREAGVSARVEPFLEDMAGAYAWADCVVARAGALTVAELQGVGLGAVLVPLPWAADDHQSANARALERAGAACVVPQDQLEGGGMTPVLGELLADRGRLLEMAEAARGLARPGAAEALAAACAGEEVRHD